MIGYDSIPEHEDILLDLPFYEGAGALTRDQAKPHHQDILLVNTPVWDAVASGLGVLTFDGISDQYLELDHAACADLDFTAGSYSIGVWINWVAGFTSEILIGRYGVNFDGWEIYLDPSGVRNTVSQRHSHVSLTPNTNSNCYSEGWTQGIWHLLGISRTGGNLYPVHHRNGIALPMSYEASGILDADACNRDLVIGCRYTKDSFWYKGSIWRPRIWGRALTASEWLNIFERERGFFGV